MNVKVNVLSGALVTILAGMTKAVEAEAGIRDNVATALGEAQTSAWATLRDGLKAVLTAPVKKAKKGEEPEPTPIINAGLLLDALRDHCKEAGKTQASMKKGEQYASNLRRAVKLAEKTGKPVPSELWKATRTEWLESEEWTKAGILKASGGRKKAEAKDKEEGEGGDGRDAIVNAAEEAGDKGLSDLFRIVSKLHGPFKAEWMQTAMDEARRVMAKQTASGGNGHVEASDEEGDEDEREEARAA